MTSTRLKNICIIICSIFISVSMWEATTRIQIINSDSLIIKRIETYTAKASSNNAEIVADITFLWSDSHTDRNDRTDERVCSIIKLQKAFKLVYKDIEINSKNAGEICFKVAEKFIDKESGEADWVSIVFKSIKIRLPNGQDVETIFGVRFNNPYYVDNWYFEKIIFPNLMK